MSEKKYNFDWEEWVVIAANAPEIMRPNQIGLVVGMRLIENEIHAISAGYPVHTVMYMIEFIDGVLAEIPEFLLRHRVVADQDEPKKRAE